MPKLTKRRDIVKLLFKISLALLVSLTLTLLIVAFYELFLKSALFGWIVLVLYITISITLIVCIIKILEDIKKFFSPLVKKLELIKKLLGWK